METLLAFALSVPTWDDIQRVVLFLVVLSILVVLHEGGHFLVARWNGVRVNDFAVGFGPTLLKWTSPRTGTNYRLNLLPIGGYCAMQGEDGRTSEAELQREFRAGDFASERRGGGTAVLDRPLVTTNLSPVLPSDGSDNFQAKAPWRRLAIVVAGPIANFIAAYVILIVAAVTFGIPNSHSTALIGPVIAGSPADRAGLQLGDRLVSIDGVAYTNGDEVVKKIRESPGIPLILGYERHGQAHSVRITPRSDVDDPKHPKVVVGRIGFQVVPALAPVGLGEAFSVSSEFIWRVVVGSIGAVGSLISNPPTYFGHVRGVIGMGQMAAQLQDLGWATYLTFAAQISIALGVLNLLPFPALDGGRGVFIIAEMFRGRPVDAEKEAVVHFAGFAMLMVLMVFVAFHDISNIVSGKGVF